MLTVRLSRVKENPGHVEINADKISVSSIFELFSSLVNHAIGCGIGDITSSLNIKSTGLLLRSYIKVCRELEKQNNILDFRSFTNVQGVDFTADISVMFNVVMINSPYPVHTEATVIVLGMNCPVDFELMGISRQTFEMCGGLLVVSREMEQSHPEECMKLFLISDSTSVVTIITPDHPNISQVVHPIMNLIPIKPDIVFGDDLVSTDCMWLC